MKTIEVPNVTKPSWWLGAWTIAYIYSNKGNYILKGWRGDVLEYIHNLNIRYFVNFVLYHQGTKRNIWDCSNPNVTIFEPKPFKRGKHTAKYHFRVKNYDADKTFKLKRLPKRYVEEIFG